jgi:transcriptional regulator with XRE-family HTH domain
VADRVGRQHSTLSHWQHGLRVPSRERLNALLLALDVPDDEHDRLLTLHQSIDGAEPPWPLIGEFVVRRTGLPPTHVADVLDALALYCEASPEMCATTVDASDLRAIAAALTL